MAWRRSPTSFEPLTDAELTAVENRVRKLPSEWPRDEVLRLIAEVRQARTTFGAGGQQSEAPTPRDGVAPTADPHYTPPGGRVTLAEWETIAQRLEAERARQPQPRPLSARKQDERRRRWEELRARLGWDAQAPLTPEQEAEVNALVREELQAYRQEKRRERKPHAGGR